MNKNINRVVAYGCSFTAGDEIMDHVFMNVSFEECNNIKKHYIANGNTLDAKLKYKNDHNIWAADEELNRNHTWAAQLAQHLELSFVNRAINGASIDQTYFSICDDLLRGKLTETDLVLVGLTTPFRIVDFRDEKMVKTLLPNHLDAANLENKMLVNLFNDDFAFFHYFKTVELLHNLNSKITVRLQPMVSTLLFSGRAFSYKINHTKGYINSVWNNCSTSMLLPNEFLQDHIVNGAVQKCGFNHPPLESHIELAEKIHKQIKF